MLIRPRLTEHHGIFKPQIELDFAIPFLDEDLPLYVDPFLLWKSPSHQDQALHTSVVAAFNNLGHLARKGNEKEALSQLQMASECDEVGLGQSASRKGKRIGEGQAREILSLFERIPQYKTAGISHFEEIQFFVQGISKDRISDFACSFLKSFLIDFTIDECNRLSIPLQAVQVPNVYALTKGKFETVKATLPVHPRSGAPIVLVPKRWLRFSPWLDFEEYFRDYCPKDRIFGKNEPEDRVQVLAFNRDNYGVVEAYIKQRELRADDCKNDPLFSQLPIISAKRHWARIEKLPTGKDDSADKHFEEGAGQLLASMMYPHLDFAQMQARTDSGAQIRDVFFYNNRSQDFLREIFDDYGSRQLVMELKNVKAIDRDHINQLNRYLTDGLGKFGVLVTRNEIPRAMKTQLVDLWAGQRRCVICLTDGDMAQMVQLFETKQRLPLDVLKKKYVEFRRECPA